MTKQEEEHLARVKLRFYSLVDQKFRHGAEEHQNEGALEDQTVTYLLNHAIDEAIDQVVYLLTLKDALERTIFVTKRVER